MLWTHWVLIVLFCVLRLYSILPTSGRLSRWRVKRKSGASIAVFLGSGGHTTEALTLLSALDPERYRQRSYIVSEGDELSTRKAEELELRLSKTKQSNYSIISIPRARRVHQSFVTVPMTAAISLFSCIYHFTIAPLLNQQGTGSPDVLLLNGPGTCFVICFAMYINRFLGLHSPCIIYVETFARIHTMSLSGKLMRPLADRFVTQWPHSEQRLSDEKWLV